MLSITKQQLEELYIDQRLSSLKIGEKLGIPHRTIRKKLNRFNIPTRSLSEANTRKRRLPFADNKAEAAFLLGMRAGDFHAKTQHLTVRFQTSTTHIGQYILLQRALGQYADVCTWYMDSSRNKAIQDEIFIYTDLDATFWFLLTKPEVISKWILKDNEYFMQFLAAYFDCEGNLKISKSHEKHARFFFRIRSGDKTILQQIQERLESKGYKCNFYHDKEKGEKIKTLPYTYNVDIFNLVINQKAAILSIIKDLVRYSRHPEKIAKMQFMLRHEKSNWKELEPEWITLKANITASNKAWMKKELEKKELKQLQKKPAVLQEQRDKDETDDRHQLQ